ncbi:MAG: glycosyltransferase family 4 protein [Chlorobiaceae bacterium]|nr:glycosyltransferase family 4 protein [Chlorobiaceae bacterium]
MNIMIFDASPRWSGGANRIYLFAKELKRRGHNVIVCCLPGSGLSEKLPVEDIGTITINPISEANILMVSKIRKLIRRYNIDLIEICSPKFYWISSLAGRITGKKILLTRNVPYRKKGIKKYLNRILYHNLTDAIIAVSARIGRELAEDFMIPDGKISIIHDGLDMQPYRNPKPLSFRKYVNEKVVAVISRLDEHKGLECFVNAISIVLRNMTGVHFLIVGTGGIEQKLRKLAAQLGILDSVTFTGFRQDIPEILAGVDITVIPSPLEGMSMSAIESMATGRPIVATSGGGLIDIITEGVSGIIVNPEDIEDLAEGILRLLESDYRKIGQESRRIAQEQFDLGVVVSKYESLASRLTGQSFSKLKEV